MNTHTFITILAWIVAIYAGLIVIRALPAYLSLRVNSKGWVILALFVTCLWWLLCK